MDDWGIAWEITLRRSIVTEPRWQSLQWRHYDRDGVSHHQPHNRLLNRLFGRRSKKIPKPRVTGLCAGNSPVTGEFPAQMASKAETVSIWWRHHDDSIYSFISRILSVLAPACYLYFVCMSTLERLFENSSNLERTMIYMSNSHYNRLTQMQSLLLCYLFIIQLKLIKSNQTCVIQYKEII